MESGRIVEPLSSFYKDEVREIGRELGLADRLLNRHPFPGPGLAIRCLCSDFQATVQPAADGWIAPIRSVGVQGDSRSYRAVLILADKPSEEAFLRATRLANQIAEINRVIACIGSKILIERLEVTRGFVSDTRLERLRLADSIVRRRCEETGFDTQVWQFPVVLIPLGDAHAPDSVVLRPIHSVDGMTAQAVSMPVGLLQDIVTDILEIEGVCGVFYDLTNKPPATIEWE
jgi:GMP synthase (glutamine-hydrolysing)